MIHGEANEIQRINQNPDNWGRGYFKCVLITGIFYTVPKCKLRTYFRSLANYWYIKRNTLINRFLKKILKAKLILLLNYDIYKFLQNRICFTERDMTVFIPTSLGSNNEISNFWLRCLLVKELSLPNALI